MNTQTITIQERQFQVPAPYAAGHQIDDGEAHALNQVLAENVRNNFGAMLKKNPNLGQTELDAYTGGYKFGARSGGTRTGDPVTAECRRLAKAAVIGALQKKGYKIKDIPKEQLDNLVSQAAPKFRAKAEAIVADRREAVAAVSDLDLTT